MDQMDVCEVTNFFLFDCQGMWKLPHTSSFTSYFLDRFFACMNVLVVLRASMNKYVKVCCF